jgi:hypothetical protein
MNLERQVIGPNRVREQCQEAEETSSRPFTLEAKHAFFIFHSFSVG